MIPNEKTLGIYNSLNSIEKDNLYRLLWRDYVIEDIQGYLEERDDIKLSDDEIEYAADLYVYNGKYDCNLDYWANIENVVEYALSR